MPRTVYYAAASLDGYIAEADDSIDWLTGYEGTYDRFYDGIGALVSGSVTYEWILDHMTRTGGDWPYAGKPCFVLSSRELAVPEGDDVDVRIVERSVADLHPELVTAAGDRALWIVNGENVASQFADHGLLDVVQV